MAASLHIFSILCLKSSCKLQQPWLRLNLWNRHWEFCNGHKLHVLSLSIRNAVSSLWQNLRASKCDELFLSWVTFLLFELIWLCSRYCWPLLGDENGSWMFWRANMMKKTAERSTGYEFLTSHYRTAPLTMIEYDQLLSSTDPLLFTSVSRPAPLVKKG